MPCEQINVVDGKYVTFGEMISLTRRLAGGLSAAGFKPRDRLLTVCHNIPEYAALFVAVARCRGHLTTLNPAATDGLLIHCLLRCFFLSTQKIVFILKMLSKQ